MPYLRDALLGPKGRALAAAAALGAGLLASGRLAAQELGAILLNYRAPPGCPEVAEFQRSVQRRSSRIRFVDEGTHERELSVLLTKSGASTIGELRLTESDGSLRQRSVRFTTCAEAVEGLALISAVSLDPKALLSEPNNSGRDASELPPQAAKKPLQAKKAAPLRERATGRADAAPSERQVRVGLGAQLSAAFQQVPRAAFGGALFFDLESRTSALFSPFVRVAISHVERRAISRPGFDANFALTLATVSACPLRMAGGFLTLRPCFFGSAGALRAWASATESPQTLTRQYWAWGGAAMIMLRASQTTELIGDIALGAALFRDRFEFDRAQFWQTPALYVSTSVGIRFVFP